MLILVLGKSILIINFSLYFRLILIKKLKNNFNINSRISLKRPGQWIIVIPKSEVAKVAKLTMDHMHPSMYYKIG